MNRREALTIIAASTAYPASLAYAARQKNGPLALSSGNVFNPRQFGAIGDGKVLDSPAINAATNACN